MRGRSGRPRRSPSCSTRPRCSCSPPDWIATTSTDTCRRSTTVQTLRIAVPNKGTLSGPAAQMLREAGYRQRTDDRDLVCRDDANGVEFIYLRPRDIATYVGSGDLD